jgi:SAM-dependent methyltransferase
MAFDRHVLYEAAVQGVEYDLDLFQRIYRRHRGRHFTRLREDFCGTAALACAWARRGSGHEAWAVDIDREVLDWARAHRLPRLRRAAARVRLVRADVRRSGTPRVDFVCAMNFSYWVFQRRRDLVGYFRSVRGSLRPGGVFACNAFGGTGAEKPLVERTRIPASRSGEGDPVPAFTYVWQQVSFNPIDHHLVCDIHFRFRDGTRMKRAFHYDWRLWTLPEIADALREAGFRGVHVYVEGWDERRHRPDDIYRLRTRFENQHGWLACVVGLR